VLDEILDNETELPILEHTTDTAGYTDLVFALFDLLGLQFSPRLRDIGDQRLSCIARAGRYPNLDPFLAGNYINTELILKYWDDLLRVAGSLKVGWVTASLFIAKLQSYRRNSTLTRALQDYGRLVRTIFILRWLDDTQYRRRIGAQLNKGEAIHSLRGFLFSGHEGQIRHRHHEDLVNQAACLKLVSNAVIVWNTVYMQAIFDLMRAEGRPPSAEDVVHLSPARYEHVNIIGKFRFDLDVSVERLRELRPRREAESEVQRAKKQQPILQSQPPRDL
jgi:TnpA family transposase